MSTQEDTPVLEQPAPRGILLAVLSVIWLIAMLFSARVTITGRADAETEVTSTAYALPGAVTASLVTGAALALAVLGLITRRRTPGATARFGIATGTGLLVGLAGALTIVTINTDGWVYAVVGGTIAAAATIGGALAGFRAPRVLAAVCWASIAVFLVGFVLNVFQDPILHVLGSGSTQASQTSAAQWFSFAQSALSGVAAGLVSFRVLRRSRDNGLRWPFYALAGLGPGLLLVVGEGLTRTAGSRVLDLAGQVSVLEQTVQKLLSESRFNNALIVLFIGGFSAMVAIGRTMSPRVEEPEAVSVDQA